MPDHIYTPSSGALSGPSLVQQNEAILSRMRRETEDARHLADQALANGRQALAIGQQALELTRTAMEGIDRARLTVEEARGVAAEAHALADTVLAQANAVYDRAAIVISSVAGTRELLEKIDEATTETVDDTQKALAAAYEAMDMAGDARILARAAMRLARQALGVFRSEPRPVDADELYAHPEKLYLLNAQSTGLPVAPPLFLDVRMTDAGVSTCQRAWNAQGSWKRSAALTRAVNPGEDAIALALVSEDEERRDGNFSVVCDGAALTAQVSPGVFQQSLTLPHMLKGVLAFSLEEDFKGEVLLEDRVFVTLGEEGASLQNDTLETEKGTLTVATATFADSVLQLELTYAWSEVSTTRVDWSDWVSLVRDEHFGEFMRTTDQAVDPDACIESSARFFLTNPACPNLPAPLPLFLSVTRETSGTSVTQVAWNGNGAGIWMRTARLKESGPEFTPWRELSRYRPVNGTLKIPAVPYARALDLGEAAEVELGRETPSTVLVSPNGDLAVRLPQLDVDLDKYTTLVIRARSPMAITWEGQGYTPEWAGPTRVFELDAGETAVVGVWQIESLIVLETVLVADAG